MTTGTCHSGGVAWRTTILLRACGAATCTIHSSATIRQHCYVPLACQPKATVELLPATKYRAEDEVPAGRPVCDCTPGLCGFLVCEPASHITYSPDPSIHTRPTSTSFKGCPAQNRHNHASAMQSQGYNANNAGTTASQGCRNSASDKANVAEAGERATNTPNIWVCCIHEGPVKHADRWS